MAKKDNNQKQKPVKKAETHEAYMKKWQQQNRDKVYEAQARWKAKNQDYVRYKRAFSAAKNFIQPKEGSANEQACQWALTDKNDKANYVEDLQLLHHMIEERLEKVSQK